jgi:EmrB/QacA subfamily drug resistance transporter
VTTAPPLAADALPRLNSARGRWIIVATSLGSGMVFLDGSVVNVALPKIQTSLGVPLSSLQWIVDSYALVLAALLLVGGALGDIIGRKRIFLAGLGVFTLGSVACGLSPNANILIAARSLQGLGGALLVPGSLAQIKSIIALEDSARAIGVWAGLSGATSALGPLVGGYLVGAVSWRLIFFINVPLAVVTALATIMHIPETKDSLAGTDVDWLGAIATIVGLGGITYGLIQGPAAGWGDPLVVGSLAIGALALASFPVIELHVRQPMVPLKLFRSRNFTGSNLATTGVYFSFNGAFLFLVLKLQQIQGYTPLEAGAALIPITFVLLVLSPRVGGLLGRYGARALMSVGSTIIATAFVLFAVMGTNPPYWTALFPVVVVLAMGMVIFITPLTATVMGAVPSGSVGVASGVNNAVSRVAGVLAVAILGLVVVTQFRSDLSTSLAPLNLPAGARTALVDGSTRLARDRIPHSLPPSNQAEVRSDIRSSYLFGFRWAMGTCAGLCFFSAIASFVVIRRDKTD